MPLTFASPTLTCPDPLWTKAFYVPLGVDWDWSGPFMEKTVSVSPDHACACGLKKPADKFISEHCKATVRQEFQKQSLCDFIF